MARVSVVVPLALDMPAIIDVCLSKIVFRGANASVRATTTFDHHLAEREGLRI
jgi:hypothetical protein